MSLILEITKRIQPQAVECIIIAEIYMKMIKVHTDMMGAIIGVYYLKNKSINNCYTQLEEGV
jgi:hypothetical protein